MIDLSFRQRCAVVCAVLGACAATARAQQDTVHIAGAYDSKNPPGIAVMPVIGPNGDSVQAIIQRDLQYSDFFVSIPLVGNDPRAFRDSASGTINYGMFSGLGAANVVQITPVANGLHVTLHYVKQKQARARDYTISAAPLSRDWRLSIHVISDAIQEEIAGVRGIAATRIAYESHQRNDVSLHVVDSDGANDIVVPSQPHAQSPSWEPTGAKLVYCTFGDPSAIYTLTLATGRTQTLVPKTVNVSVIGPHYTRDGASVDFWHASDLYSIAADGSGAQHQIMGGVTAVNTGLTFSPDGRRIAFMSNRAGRPQLYSTDADGTNPDQLTKGLPLDDDTYNADPDWSPDGLYIAFDSRIQLKAQIVLIGLRDHSVKYLTSVGQNEHPSWAPDGRHLVFTSDRSGVEQLWVLDIESATTRQLTHSSSAKTASWSPRLQP